MKSKRISIIIKVVAVFASIYGMSWSIFDDGFMTFFTNLSNIFVDVGLLVSLVYVIKDKKPSNKWYLCRFLLTVSILLTFLIYMLVLAPTFANGFFAAYANNHFGSFCVHFVTPVLAIADFIIYDIDFVTKKIYAFIGIIPPLMYVVYIVILGQCFSYRWYGYMYAPYNFLNYGAPCGWFGIKPGTMGADTLGIGVAYMIFVLCIIFILLGLFILKICNIRKNRLA